MVKVEILRWISWNKFSEGNWLIITERNLKEADAPYFLTLAGSIPSHICFFIPAPSFTRRVVFLSIRREMCSHTFKPHRPPLFIRHLSRYRIAPGNPSRANILAPFVPRFSHVRTTRDNFIPALLLNSFVIFVSRNENISCRSILSRSPPPCSRPRATEIFPFADLLKF